LAEVEGLQAALFFVCISTFLVSDAASKFRLFHTKELLNINCLILRKDGSYKRV
jgi:hypothetical protein